MTLVENDAESKDRHPDQDGHGFGDRRTTIAAAAIATIAAAIASSIIAVTVIAATNSPPIIPDGEFLRSTTTR